MASNPEIMPNFSRRSFLIFLLRMGLAIGGVALLWVMLFQAQDPVWQRLQDGMPLRVAMDPSFPPFENVDAHGELVGFDVDLARELGQRLGVEVQFLPIAFDGLADAVMAGTADVVISAFPFDERLTEDVRYSIPYFEGGLIMVTRIGSAISGPDQLGDKQVAVEWGGQGDAWARQHGLEHIVRLETPDDALRAVLSGDADAAIVDAVTAALFPEQGLSLHAPPLESEPYVIVLPKKAAKLTTAINEALTDLMADGVWDQLAARYFPTPPLVPNPPQDK